MTLSSGAPHALLGPLGAFLGLSEPQFPTRECQRHAASSSCHSVPLLPQSPPSRDALATRPSRAASRERQVTQDLREGHALWAKASQDRPALGKGSLTPAQRALRPARTGRLPFQDNRQPRCARSRTRSSETAGSGQSCTAPAITTRPPRHRPRSPARASQLLPWRHVPSLPWPGGGTHSYPGAFSSFYYKPSTT